MSKEVVLYKEIDSRKIAEFRRGILSWGRQNMIGYPWRTDREPFRVLIAEILLHRTRAEQVVSLYTRFLERFPDISHISSADYEDVERILRPAGLRWRIRNLYLMAQIISERHGGTIPENYEDLISLPGVSSYIASAVRCFAFGYPEPLLDTNTVRIAGRVFGLQTSDRSRRSIEFRKLMDLLIDRDNPEVFNYSMIDLGKLVCRARKPVCTMCPVMHICEYQLNLQKNKTCLGRGNSCETF